MEGISTRRVVQCVVVVAVAMAAAGFVRGIPATADGWIDFSGSVICGLFTVLAGALIWKAARHQSEISLQELIATDEFHFRRDRITSADFAARTQEAKTLVHSARLEVEANASSEAIGTLALDVEHALLPIICVENKFLRYVMRYDLDRLAWLASAIRHEGSAPDGKKTSLARILAECERLLNGIDAKTRRLTQIASPSMLKYAV
ncbi:hypothetical protein [Azorhizobium caulinodans]|nr:hypothetical protein [Azorhizobium caulinodans]